MTSIGIDTKDTIVKLINGLIEENLIKIDKAYSEREDDFTMSLAVKISPNDPTMGNDVEVKLRFTEGIFLKKAKATVNEKQLKLFEVKG
jgi:hypothetical protein